MAKSQSRVKQISPKQYIKLNKQQKWTLKNFKANKFSESTIVIRFNLLQVCPSVPPFAVVVVFLSFFFYVLNSYFYVLLSLVVAPTVRILRNFVTHPLLGSITRRCLGNEPAILPLKGWENSNPTEPHSASCNCSFLVRVSWEGSTWERLVNFIHED